MISRGASGGLSGRRDSMREIIESRDWSRTPLGAKKNWPPSLQTVMAIVLGSSQPMVVVWGEQRLALYNDRFADLVVGRRFRAVGSPLFDIWPSSDDELAAIVERGFEGESTLAAESPRLSVPDGGGENLHFLCDCTPVPDAAGGVGGLLITVVETSATSVDSAAKGEFRHLDAVLASTEDFIYVFDREGKYTYANSALLRRLSDQLGLDLREILGMSFTELGYPPERVEKYERELKTVFDTGEPVRSEEVSVLPGGEVRQYEYIFTPVFGDDKEVEAVVGITRDVTELRDTAAALKRSESLYEALFESVEQGIGVVEVWSTNGANGGSTDFRWLEVNRAFEELSNINDPVGKRGREVSPRIAEFWFEIYRDVVRSGESVQFENYDEDVGRWFDVRAVPVGSNESRLVALIFTDITERKRREENAALLAELHDQLTRLADSAEIKHRVGDAVARHLDLSRVVFARLDQESDLIENSHDWRKEGMKSAAGDHKLSRFMGEEMLGQLSAGEAVMIDDVNSDRRTAERADAYREFDIRSMILVPHLSGGQWRFFTAICDDRQRTWRADELELMCELTERLWWRLERAYAEEALREVNRRKDRFLAVLSHELRNPLAPIELSLQLLESTSLDSDEGRRVRQVIARQVKQLTRLVDDLLDVNRINSEKIHLKIDSVELNELTRHTVQDHLILFDEAGITLEFNPGQGPVRVRGDRNRIAQVIGNILQNAMKFTSSGEQTVVSVSADSAEGCAEIRIRDTGTGMDPETTTSLFDPFVQADASLEHSVGGLGLGLALVKGLVELHDGTVFARSEGLGRGSEFVVRLPLEASESEPSFEEFPDEKHDVSRKILVIDDNPDVAELLRRVLELRGHLVEVVHDGSTGIEKAREWMPDAVICDIGLPGMNGYEIAGAMSDDPELQSIQLIALSGYAGAEDIEKSRRAGFEHHLAKPPNIEKLDELLS